MAKLTIVIPLLNEEESLQILRDQINESCTKAGLDYEILFIDDGSTDNSWSVLTELAAKNSNIKVIRFRKNYGKSAALAVGFQEAEGEFVITMDADLQDDPSEIPNLYNKLVSENWDLVSGWKKIRHDPVSKTLPSKLFNYVTGKLVGLRLHDFNCGFKIYRNEVVKDVHVYGELHRYIPALAHLSGFKVTEHPVIHHPRQYGKSKFGMDRFVKGFLDLATVLFITRYMRRPLHFFGGLGSLFLAGGLGINIWLTIGWLQGEIAISKRPILFLGILLTILGIQFMSTGFIGEMITKMYSKTESYSIRKKLNF
ncbi:MAG: glycosyltransferase family 2 protein [Bacteroidetes bacterium]|nr:glycosyltransferase family 2 protein [Bacteroidota bacterium]